MNLGQGPHLSGQAVQMNSGSGGRLPQHQKLQVASGHPGVDPEFESMRKDMYKKIEEFMKENLEKKMVPENLVPDIARRLEEAMYRRYPTKDDYYNILEKPIGPHLKNAIRTITAQGQQRQQMSRQIISSSSYGTMIPTSGMVQSASGNSRMPYMMDNTGGNSTAGSMSNGYQHPSTNVPLNSNPNSVSSAMSSVSMQRQETHMIPTPGFSNQQTLPANSEYSNGAGYLNEESNVMLQIPQQQKPLSSNQSCYPVQHLGGHAGSGVHSGMLENSSSYGLSNAQMNGEMGLHRSNMQIINRTAASESFTNLSPYGSSHNKPLQQQCNHPPLQRTPTSADMAASRSFYGTDSSALTATSNLVMNPANLLSNSRMYSGLLTNQTTMQSIQPQHHIKSEVLDPQEKVNFRKSQLPREQLLQQQHQLQPNHPHSQFMQNQYSFSLQQQNIQHHQVMWRGNSLEQCQLGSGHAEQLLDQGDLLHNELMSSQATKHSDLLNLQGHYQITSSHDNDKRGQISSQLNGAYTEPLLQPHCRSQPTEKGPVTDSLSIEKQVQDGFCQRTMAQDRAQQPVSSDRHIAGCAVTSLDPKLSKLPTRGSEQATRNIKNYRIQLRWLLMLIHAKDCPAPIGSCKSQYCVCVQELVKHLKYCQAIDCSYRYCRVSKKVFYHYKNCIDEHCPVCSKAKERLRHSSEQAHKHSPAEPILITQQNTIQRITNGVHDDRMDIDLVAAETFDDQPSAPKRLRLQPVFSNSSSDNGISPVPVPEVNPGFVLQEDHPRQLEQNNKMVPKQAVNVRVDMQPPQKPAIIGYGTDGQIGAMPNNVIRSVLNEIDSHVKQSLAEKEMNENVLDVKNKTNSSTDVTMSKLGKPKIKGVSLMELFTPEQINEHTDSLRQWIGQSKAKAEKNQAIGLSENENSCQLCKVEKLNFEPPPIYCSPCGARIKRNASYYTGSTTETRHHFCTLCYNESRSHTIGVEGTQFLKANLEKRRNDDESEEGWVQCDKCECWQHQICALFNVRRNDGGEAEYTCHNCYVHEIQHGLRMPLPQSAVLGAKDLPRTVLSDHIEERLFKRLRDERQERANLSQKSFDEVPGVDGLVVRVVSSVDKKLEVKPRFFEIFQEDNYPAEFPYKSKAILLFQKIEGVEVCLFGMYVQEFGAECAFPNQRRVYLSYLDSVKYFRPEIKTVSGEALRTYVYHEILIGYLEYCKQRGFTSCYIWACPPLKGEDYILYCHPEIQKTPKSDKLREWYLSMLRKAIQERIVVELTNLYDHFFIATKECKAKVTAARLPYFDGDYWPGAAEDMINQLRLEEDGGKLQKGKIKKTITKRALKAAGHTDLSGNASKDAMLMQKLGETIKQMKEDFIMVHLQYSCSHCSILMVSGRRWVCDQCKSFYICDKCYDAERRLEENERHPSNSRDSHTLHPVEIVRVPEDTKDRDDILESEFFDTRQAFLSLCQGNHYQYDTLRRAKHSSMMVLYHLHNPTAPAFVTTCNVCNHDIETGQGWRCEECPDFDVCAACYQKDGGASHRHKLTHRPSSADRNAQNKEARQKRVQQVRVMLELLVHVSLCRVPDCQYPNCRRVKGLFRHAHHCKIRASGGCEPCKKMWSLIRLHSRACKESNCGMPRCRDLKDHIRRLQQQSDSRRRAAVNEMMRQRAAEVAGN